MDNWIKRILRTLKLGAIPYLICVLMFYLDPSLNLKKIVSFYGQRPDVSLEYLKETAFSMSIKGCILSLVVITLLIYILTVFGLKKMLISMGGIFVLLNSLGLFGFPNIFQVAVVWSKFPHSMYGDFERYDLLISWLIGWSVALLINIWLYYKHANRDK